MDRLPSAGAEKRREALNPKQIFEKGNRSGPHLNHTIERQIESNQFYFERTNYIMRQ